MDDSRNHRIQLEAERLRKILGATRVTVRTIAADLSNRLVAEALQPGERSLYELKKPGNDPTIPGTTYWWMARELRPLIQNDFDGDTPQPPAHLKDVYRVRAQMLSPIIEGTLVGLISVHQADAPRIWTMEDSWELGRTTGLLAGVMRHDGAE